MTSEEAQFVQVIEHMTGDTIRVYRVVAKDSHVGTEDDPLTTIVISGWTDMTYGKVKDE